MIRFKITSSLLSDIQHDLRRSHPFAKERVGFITTGVTVHKNVYTLLAHSFFSIKDEDYIFDPNIGAKIGPDAVFMATSLVYEKKQSVFSVHMHCGNSIPKFSEVDLECNRELVPCFFDFRPELPHGALVINNRRAFGDVWFDQMSNPKKVDEFFVIGSQVYKWRT